MDKKDLSYYIEDFLIDSDICKEVDGRLILQSDDRLEVKISVEIINKNRGESYE